MISRTTYVITNPISDAQNMLSAEQSPFPPMATPFGKSVWVSGQKTAAESTALTRTPPWSALVGAIRTALTNKIPITALITETPPRRNG